MEIFDCILLICRSVHEICFYMIIFRKYFLMRLLSVLFCLTSCMMSANVNIIYLFFLQKVYRKNFTHSACIFVRKLKVSVGKVNIHSNLITLQKVIKERIFFCKFFALQKVFFVSERFEIELFYSIVSV